MKAGSDLIRRVNRSRDEFVEIDPTSTQEEKIFSASIRAYTSGIASSPQSTDSYYKRGYANALKGHHKDAIEDFTRAVELNESFGDAWNARGNCHFAIGDLETAISDFRKAIEANPAVADCYYNLGNAEYKLAHYDIAIQMFTRAIAIDEDFVSAYCNRASAYKKTNSFDKAIEDLTQAMAVQLPLPQKDLIALRMSRGDAYYTKEYMHEAIDDMTAALSMNPGCGQAYALRAGALVGLQQYEKAVQDGTMAAQKDPTCASAYFFLGQAQHYLGHHVEALDNLSQAVSLCDEESKPEYLYMRGRVRDELGDREGAASDLHPALSADPELLQLDLAAREAATDPDEVDARNRKNEVAIAHASENIKETGGDAETYFARGCGFRFKADYDRALSDFSTQLTSVGLPGLMAHFWSGQVHDDLGNFAEAIEYYTHALGMDLFGDTKEITKSKSRIHAARAQSLLKTGRLEESVEDATKAITLDETSAEAYAVQGAGWLAIGTTLLSETLVEWKQSEETAEQAKTAVEQAQQKASVYRADAIKALDTALQLDPECVFAYSSRSSAHFGNHDYKAAFQDYQTATSKDPKLIGKTAEKVMAEIELERQLAATDNSVLLSSTMSLGR